MGRIFAIGDIHGCYDKLDALMYKLDINFYRDTLVFLGDYIDRGLHSFEVVEYLINLRERFKRVIFLKGNHEEMLEHYLTGVDRFTYLINGGQQTLDSYRKNGGTEKTPIPKSHQEFFSSLHHYYETDDYIFVHAGIRDDIPLPEQDTDDLLWIRRNFIQSEKDYGKRVIFGHTPFPDPFVQPNKIGIDTGAVFGNKLTCVKLPEVEFYFA